MEKTNRISNVFWHDVCKWMIMLFCLGMLFYSIPVDAASKIALNSYTYVMNKGSSTKLTATIISKKYKSKKVVWSTSKKKIATVSSKGVVKAKKAGTTTITAKIKGTSYKAKCRITVRNPVKSITLSKGPNVLFVGETHQIKAKVSPSSATVKTVSYVSSDPKIATVNSAGLVTARGSGTVTITACSNDGLNVKSAMSIRIKDYSALVCGTNISALPVNTKKVMSLMTEYSAFIKNYGKICYNSSSNNVKTYQAAKTKAAANQKIGLNCACPITWALVDIGLLPSGTQLYGDSKGFNSSGEKALNNYATFITSGAGIGVNLQTASDLGALQIGDVIAYNINHTVVYAGRSAAGHALCYEAGGEVAKLGYSNAGCGPIDYYSRYKSYKITAICRLN